MSEFHARLVRYLESADRPFKIQQLTPDASSREYFRVLRDDSTMIACVYPEPFFAKEQSYLDVTALFISSGLPVAKVLDFDEALGIILIEDMGDTILRDVLLSTSKEIREGLIDKAIWLIARIQAATDTAFETNSVASRLRFDQEKFLWELEFFQKHYFTTYLKKPFSEEENYALREEFIELSRELETKAKVLCHRDFHAANLMVDSSGDLRIIDHQDARIGSVSYDLVSLLLDRVTELPSGEWLAGKRRLFLSNRIDLGLEPIAEEEFAYEFRMQTIQRCLKAVGTFSFQSTTRGKTYFVPFIKPMFEIVLRAAENLDRFSTLQKIVKDQIA